MIKPSPEFQAMLDKNQWHDPSEIDKFVAVIKELSDEKKWTEQGEKFPDAKYWSWARNHECKYVNLRFDMRDGGFVLRNDDERISLEQLQWQYDDESAQDATRENGK